LNLYRLYGISLASEVLFPEFPAQPKGGVSGRDAVLLRVRRFQERRPLLGSVSFWGTRYWFSPDDTYGVVRAPSLGSFRVDFRKGTIDWNGINGDIPPQARLMIRGKVLGLLLSHRPSSLILHANGVVRSSQGILLSGFPGMGKSTLTASLLNGGFSLGSDDLAVVRRVGGCLTVQPGIPEIRLWPDSLGLKPAGMNAQALYPGIRKKRLPIGKGGAWRFNHRSVPVRVLYLLDRTRGGKVRIEPLSGKEALLGVLRNLYVPIIRSRPALENQFGMAMQLSRSVPVKKLSYPSGVRFLDRVREAILEDL